jgi:hypothetical protein
MSRIISISMPKEAWEEVVNTLETKRVDLYFKSETALGVYREILEADIQELSEVLYEIKTELNLT